MELRKKEQMSKDEWINYYEYLLNQGMTTKEKLEKKYFDYQKNEEEWLKSYDRISYLNSQAALKEILDIKDGE